MATVGILVGCSQSNAVLHYLGHKPLEYYRDTATQIDYPDVRESPSREATLTDQPRTLRNRSKDEIWDLTLAEAVQIALSNASVIRSGPQFLSPGNTLLANPDQQPTVYDPAIQESGVLFGRRGVEAALADFDTQFATSMLWGRDEKLQNNIFFGGGLRPGNTLTTETGNFEAALSKQFAHGGSMRVSQTWNYLGSNVPAQLFSSSYQGSLEAQYRQPLWAGAGTEFTRIAGALPRNFSGITGVSQGVVIARINQDITLAEFEANVRNLLKDVEDTYWELYLRYRLYDAAVTARDSALRSWREAKAKLDVGGAANFKPADEAQARDRYYETRAAVERALGGQDSKGTESIYSVELKLRRLLGLPVNDGRIIRPVDEPTTARLIPDWRVSLTEALTQRVELRQQKWNIKSLELQLQAARSLTRPRLDFVSGYRVNGFGDRLFGENDDDGITAQGLHSAYETLTQGNQTGWNLGFELSMPFGFRSAHAQVRNIELRLAKSRDVLAAQELEISHELATAFQSLASQYATAQSHFNRMQAARRRVQLFEAEVQAGTATVDDVLRAQASLAQAESDYYTSLVEYNKAITAVNFRKGTLLQHDDVFLAENQWTPEAYQDALRRAWARSHGLSNPLLHTEPEEFVVPDDGTVLEMELPADPSGIEAHNASAGIPPTPTPPPMKLEPIPTGSR